MLFSSWLISNDFYRGQSLNLLFFFIGNYTHSVRLEPMTLLSTLLLQGEEVLFELDLIGLGQSWNFCLASYVLD